MVVHGGLDPYVFTYRAWQKKLWMALIGRRALARADRVLFITERERQKASPYYAGPNTTVVGLPVAMPEIERKPAAVAAARRRLRLPRDARLLVFMGRLETMKRPLETLQAFAAAAVPGVTLVLAGMSETHTPADLAERARALGVANVIVPGPMYGREKQELFLGADGYISMSWRENFGYTAAEAMAAATPVILSPGHDLGPLLADVGCGWMLPDFSHEAAVAAIRAFASSPREALERMGANGRAWAQRTLGFEAFRDNLRREAAAALVRHRERPR
jgi:glycosyltransferase involved in cell wall biosynthesis